MAKSIPEQLADQIFALLPVGTVTGFGRRKVNEHSKANRVIAVPLGAPAIDQPDIHGDARYTDAGRPLLLRRFDVEWWTHSVRAGADTQDFGATEALYLNLLRAIRQICHHSVVFTNERWIDQEDGADGLERYGSVIVVTSTIDLPVRELRGTIVQLTATPKIDTTFTLNDHEEGA